MPSFKIIGLLVLEKKILKVFTKYMGLVAILVLTLTIYINFRSPLLRRLHKIGQAVSEEMFEIVDDNNNDDDDDDENRRRSMGILLANIVSLTA